MYDRFRIKNSSSGVHGSVVVPAEQPTRAHRIFFYSPFEPEIVLTKTRTTLPNCIILRLRARTILFTDSTILSFFVTSFYRLKVLPRARYTFPCRTTCTRCIRAVTRMRRSRHLPWAPEAGGHINIKIFIYFEKCYFLFCQKPNYNFSDFSESYYAY
jgi:hypothetical protein